MTSPEVIVYGTVCLDRFLSASAAEESAVELPGGEAFNTATALAGWGVRVVLTGTSIGSDPEGERLTMLLQTHPLALGLDSIHVPHRDEAVTPVCTVRVDAHGERFMNGRGFQQAVPPPLEPLLPLFSKRPVFVVDPNLGSAAITATRAAAEAGCPIVSMDLADSPEALALSDIAVTSWEWIARAGKDADAESAARRMADAGARIAIVTLGAAGGVVCERSAGISWRYTGIVPPDPIVDTTGAGDTFRAGLAYWLLRNANGGSYGSDFARSAVRFASAAAALHCTQFGGGSRVALDSVYRLADESN